MTVTANQPAGAFMAVQTVRQLLPAEIEKQELVEGVSWDIPCSNIDDKPEYEYRGSHLDVTRHFFSVEDVKRYIDNMAQYKMNKLHLHLSDDQGWRLELKGEMYGESLSKLNTIGAQTSTSINGIKAGQYTQEEFKEIVAYAADRYIEIIPEFDMPGHSWAALVSLNFLNSSEDGKPHSGNYDNTKPYEGIDVGFSTFECRNEKTYEFIDEVFRQVSEISPSKYIHIGGDEAPRTRWAVCPKCQALVKKEGLKADKKHTSEDRLQSYCMKRVEQFLNERGRQIIGWDEILEGDVAPNATVMSWRGMQGGIEAAKLKHDVIMTPNDYVYFDYYQSADKEQEPMAMGSCITVEKVYNFEPVADELAGEEKKHILGAQANVWTEYIGTPEHVEYMMVPRMAALAEVQWMMPEKKSYQGFLNRLGSLAEFYKRDNVNYAKHILPEVVPAQTK